VDVLKSLDHPGIVRAFETFELDYRLAIVMELCRGGDLSTRRPYSERQVAIIIRQVLSAVSYLHHRNCVHRDLKIENILFQSEDPQDFRVKIIDFGLSVTLTQSESLREKVGTLYTIAPETLQGGCYSDKVDVWAVGVITHLLNSGDRPFRGDTTQVMAKNILNQPVLFDSPVWERRTQECKDFISLLLEKRPERRPDADASFKHKWLLQHDDESHSSATEAVLESIRECLIRYLEQNDFRRLALNVMAKRLSSDDLKEVRDVFLHIDEGNDGHLSIEELKKAFQRGDTPEKHVSDADIELIFRKLVR
jgi:calcium-dependent protein kinase